MTAKQPVPVSTSASKFQSVLINPYYCRVNLSLWGKFKYYCLFPLVIIRGIFMFLILVIGNILSRIAIWGVSDKKPMNFWQRWLTLITGGLVRVWFYGVAGFWWVRKIGYQASRKEAPIIVAAPHSSLFDSFLCILLWGPSTVAKSVAKRYIFCGKILDTCQPIYVDREDPNSKKNCISTMVNRSKSDANWKQLLIYPEGATTNRSCLAQFRPGAFTCGLPVQPVLVRYPNEIDSFTYTFDGPTIYDVFYTSLTQLSNFLVLEYLPVYTPSEAEIADPNLYTRNVEKVMADALGVPTTDYKLEDGLLLMAMAKTNLRKKISSIWKLKCDLNVPESIMETSLVYEEITTADSITSWDITLPRFASEIFGIPRDELPNERVKDLFELFSKNDSFIDLRAYLILSCFLYDFELETLTTFMFEKYARTDTKKIHREEFMELMRNVFESTDEELNELNAFFKDTENADKPFITLEEFRTKFKRRLEYLKLYALEATGAISGSFPKREDRDKRRRHRIKSKSN